MKLRPHQAAAEKAFFDHWDAGGGHALADMATGTGKSALIASKAKRLRQTYSQLRAVILCPSKELVAQNFAAMIRMWPDAPVGICCGGLGKNDTHQAIIFGTINSMFRRPEIFGDRHHVQIDEAHLLPPGSEEGMYHDLIGGFQKRVPDLRVSGYSASPYRIDMGRLDNGKGIFQKTVFSYGIAEGIGDGWLAPLATPAGKRAAEIDVSRVKRSGGEFNVTSLGSAADAITEAAVEEVCDLGVNRKAWLVFCAGVKNAKNTCEAFRRRGISCEVIYGDMPGGQRDSIIARYKAGQIRCLTNADVLTTGFDVAFIDLLVMLRSTLSTSLYTQINGRGTRPVWPRGFNPDEANADQRVDAIATSSKPDCLILDYAGNIRRHGPLDNLDVKDKSPKGEETGKVTVDSVRAKECPGCQELIAINAITCKICGHEFPREERPKHEAEAEKSVGILSGEKVAPQQIPVVDWRLDRYEKLGMPDSIKITFIAGISEYREWIAFEHGMTRRQHAMQWWSTHGGAAPYPKTTEEALYRTDELTMPVTISVEPNKKNRKHIDIIGRSFPARKKLEAAE